MSDCHQDGGFTLLELLVALSLLALLSLVLSGNITLGAKVWETASSQVKETERASSFDENIEDQLSHISPRRTVHQTFTKVIDFDGSTNRIEFFAEYPTGSGKISRIVYQSYPTGHTEMRSRHELANAFDRANIKSIGGIHAVRFGYYGSPDGHAVANWFDSWHEKTELPTLIRVNVLYSNGKRRALVIAPLLSADASCIYDLITHECQDS